MAGTLKIHSGTPSARIWGTGSVTFTLPPDSKYYNPGDVVRREYRILRKLGLPASSARAAVICLLIAGRNMGRGA